MCDVKAYSSAKLPAYARAVAYPDNENKLICLISLLNVYDIPHRLIGGMSNVLIKNGIYNGVLIKTDKIATNYLAENRITLGCGIRTSNVIHRMSAIGLGGMEGLAGIPGTVGGMLKQNAGAYGYEISDRFTEAKCYLTDKGHTVNLSKDEMDFSYRHSILSDSSTVLLTATFELLHGCSDDIISQIRYFRSCRAESQPIEYPSLGSVFKRHNGIGAGYYIDRSGLKGFSIGGAQISEKHAGFIINRGGATADDYIRLADYAKRRVYSEFGIELEEEIEVI